MIKDQQGNPLFGANANAAALFDQATESFSLYRGDPVALVSRAMQEAPDLTMAPILLAWMSLIGTEPAAAKDARAMLSRLTPQSRDDRSTAHLAALKFVAEGHWTKAAQLLERYSAANPRDLLALQVGHLLDFLRADSRRLRDRIARALPQWSSSVPGYGLLLGMHAFGLEECGNFGLAEEQGRRAVALQPLDAWAHHAVAHVMEMQGRPEDGIGWMVAREPHWSAEDNFFKVHNWWHRALFHLDLGQHREALTLYDGPIRQARSPVAFDLIDASALLWRFSLAGVDVGSRWEELARAWDAHADGRTYAFNDWHAVMAWLGAGREADALRLVSQWSHASLSGTENDRWSARIGLPLVEGFICHWRGDHASAVEKLMDIRQFAYEFGGSHAQRDIIDWTLTESAVRGGQTDLARALLNERTALKPRSATARGMLARLRTDGGRGGSEHGRSAFQLREARQA